MQDTLYTLFADRKCFIVATIVIVSFKCQVRYIEDFETEKLALKLCCN